MVSTFEELIDLYSWCGADESLLETANYFSQIKDNLSYDISFLVLFWHGRIFTFEVIRSYSCAGRLISSRNDLLTRPSERLKHWSGNSVLNSTFYCFCNNRPLDLNGI